MIVADTDVLIDALRGREPAASRISREMADGNLVTTAITAFELRSGAKGAKELAAVEALLGALPMLPFSDRSSQVASACRRELEAKGQTIGMGDYLIAGICISRAATLLTRNRRHFERISRLRLDSL